MSLPLRARREELKMNVFHKLNVFRKLKITQKMGLLLIVLVLGFAILGVTFYKEQQINKKITSQASAFSQLTEASYQARNDLLVSQKTLAFLLKNQDEASKKAFLQAINNSNNGTALLEKYAFNDSQQQLISQLKDAISAYQRAAKTTADTQATLGADENSGLQGPLRKVAHEIEALLDDPLANTEPTKNPSADRGQPLAGKDPLTNQKLLTSLLTLRRYEKDFIQRGREEYVDRLTKETENFRKLLEQSALPADKKTQIADRLTAYVDAFQQYVAGVKRFGQAIQKVAQEEINVENLIGSTVKVWTRETEAIRMQGDAQLKLLDTVFVAVLIGVAVIAILSALLLTLTLRRSLRRLQGAVEQVSAGDLRARAHVSGNDELALLGNAFDRMLDERITDLAKQAEESEQINNSVIQLMDAADRLCQRDLTVMVPVSADITGNVSDALNQMTRQTARVMGDINQLAAQLETIAGAVHRQGGKVSDVATVEREVVRQVLDKLAQSATTMAEMVKLAASCNEISDKASRSTKQALLTVRNTVQSINGIRSSVSETEKGIKRLGERSQEIGGIVEIIKDIAERTHTLAINAGMQAVAAGEAGRGFSVVADEVQRLAETARESTRQIATLVQSIQAESSETMSTMNKTIGQVVAGSELAEKAGQRMRFTQRNTQELVAAVQQIAERSKVQEAINVELHDQANKLEQSTAATEKELREQIEQAENMFAHLNSLVKSVRVFKLPEAA